MLFTPVKPMTVSAGKEPFDSGEFIFEPKWDGERILLHKQGERMEAYTRNGRKVTGNFPELKEAAAAIKAHSAVLDCEGVCLRGGRPVFDDIVYRIRLGTSIKIRHAVQTHPATFVAFDVLYTDREHLREPLMIRKQRLGELVSSTAVVTPTLFMETEGKSLFEMTKQHQLEGIVAKKKSSAYLPDTRSPDWIKIKHLKTVDAVILGYRTEPFGLVIGLNFRTVKNKPVGLVEDGFTTEDRHQFLELAKGLKTGGSQQIRQTQWIEPRLCCRIQYLERTDTHQLKETVFLRFLFDKNPEECVWSG